MSVTTINYNGVQMENVQTEPYHQRQIFDEYQRDPLFIEKVIRFETVLHAQTSTFVLGVDTGSDLAAGVRVIESALLTPRRRFTMWVNGSVLYDVYPGAAERGVRTSNQLGRFDVNNGPKTEVQVTKITGGKSFHIQMTVTLCVPNCAGNTASDGILSVNWRTDDDIEGDSMLTRRRVEGYVRLASRKVNPHSFRNFVLGPPLARNFRLARAHYGESPDGLTLYYSFEQEEMARLPPKPATFWRGRFRASTYKPGGMLWAGELTVTLKGPYTFGLLQLHALAKKIMDSKLNLTNRLNNKSAYPENYAIDEDLANAEVTHTCRIRYQKGAGGQVADTMNMPLEDLGFKSIPGYDPAVAHSPPPTASSKGILHAAIQSQCGHNEMPQSSTVSLRAGAMPVAQDEPVVVDQGTLEASQGTLVDFESQSQNPLTWYAVTSDYRIKSGRIHLPVGKSSSGATSRTLVLHQGHARRFVRIDAERLDKWPTLPGQDGFIDENRIAHNVLSYRPQLNDAILSADGKRLLFSGSLDIEYGLSRAPNDGDNIAVGQLPNLIGLPPEQTSYDSRELASPSALLGGRRVGVIRS